MQVSNVVNMIIALTATDLLEPFLLPSLVGAIRWMTTYVWEQAHHNLDVIMQMLQRVTRPPAAAGDAQAMHATIMSIIARPLSRSLETIKARQNRTDVDPLLNSLKPYMHFRWSASASFPMHETSWLPVSASLTPSFRNTLQHLINWSTNAITNTINTTPGYVHRQLLVTVQLLGAKAVLHLLLDEIKARTATGDGTAPLAIDVAASMICAPATENSPITPEWIHGSTSAVNAHHGSFRLNLRDVLNIEFENAAETMKTDSFLAEAIVRLHRRVEAQLALPPITEDMAAQSMQVPGMLPGLDAASAVAAAAAAAPVDLSAVDVSAMDLTGADTASMAMDLDSTTSGMDLLGTGGLGGNDDDVFAGLGFEGTDLDFGID
jgi:mediator of RNA polymerase II transcription subunit 5